MVVVVVAVMGWRLFKVDELNRLYMVAIIAGGCLVIHHVVAYDVLG
jgi:hypothetical protein